MNLQNKIKSLIAKKSDSIRTRDIINVIKSIADNDNQGGGNTGLLQMYECFNAGFTSPGGTFTNSYKGDDEQRRKNNIDVYNKLYDSYINLLDEIDNESENYNINDLMSFAQNRYVYFIADSVLKHNVEFNHTLFKCFDYDEYNNYTETGDIVGCFIFETINQDLPFVYLCADGTCYYVSGF